MRSVYFPRLLNGSDGDPGLYVRLAHRGEALLFDCGDLGRLSTRDLLKVGHVFISHAHIDHLIGFDQLLRALLYHDRTLHLYGPAGFAVQIEGRLSGYTWNLTKSYPLALRVREWEDGAGREVCFRATNSFRPEERGTWSCPGGLLLANDHLEVRALALDHGGITSLAFALQEPLHVAIHKDALDGCGYRPGPWLTRFKDSVRRGETAIPVRVPLTGGGEKDVDTGVLQEQIAHTERGMKVVYVTDATPHAANLEKIAAFAAGAHLLAIEAVFAHAELDRAFRRNHLTARLAGELARKAGAARLLTFHHSPRYQDRPGLLAAEAAAAFGGSHDAQ